MPRNLCLVCGEIAQKIGAKYCSRKCFYASKANPVLAQRCTCGATFHARAGQQKHCSPKCAGMVLPTIEEELREIDQCNFELRHSWYS